MPPLPYLQLQLQLQLQLHGIVFLFAATAFLGHVISLSAPAVVIWRTALAAIGAAAVVLVGRRATLFPPRRTIAALMAIGAIAGIHWLCFFGAIRLANVSMCLAGMATTSLFTAFTEPLLEGRKVRPLEVALGCLVAVGILLVAGFERGRLAGLLLALFGAFLAAIFPVFNRRLVRSGSLDPMVMVAWEMLGALAACQALLPLIPASGGYVGLLAWKGFDWLWLLILALVCTVFAHAVHIALLRQITAYAANLANNLEPVYGILGAAWLFGEHRDLHPGFYAGAATILAANVLHPLLARSEPTASAP
jgi:drug/metabolite transporter (DMT)-like permease